jgi:predicted lipid-binding transport protein (Tim44 family)
LLEHVRLQLLTLGFKANMVTIEIVLLAMVAAFLGLRLYTVLGRRTGHEQEPLPSQPVEERKPIITQPVAPTADGSSGASIPESRIVDYAAESGIRSIGNADRQFDSMLFVEGAKSAYGMILDAFWQGDKERLRFLCDDDVYDSFAETIDARTERGETLENRLVRIDEARIVDARFDHPVARIAVQFDADIAALVRDKDGNVIGGSMSDAVETHDVWTFFRNLKSGDRNWKLDETDTV